MLSWRRSISCRSQALTGSTDQHGVTQFMREGHGQESGPGSGLQPAHEKETDRQRPMNPQGRPLDGAEAWRVRFGRADSGPVTPVDPISEMVESALRRASEMIDAVAARSVS
jgi:hypothetical protein